MNIVIISSTNREGSMSLKVSKKMEAIYQELGANVQVIDLRLLPTSIFQPDVYKNKPAELQPFIDAILQADGLLFVVPEYNGSFPGILKYYIDMWKYPDCFENVCVAYIGIASGQWGGLRAIEHLQGVMGYRNAYQLPHRVFINSIYSRWKDGVFHTLHEKEYSIEDLLREQSEQLLRFCAANKTS